VDALRETSLFREHSDTVLKAYPQLPLRKLIHETVRRMMNAFITDLIAESQKRLQETAPGSIDDVRKAGRVHIGFSPAMQERSTELHHFLRKQLYEHEHVREMTHNAARMVTGLFESYLTDIGRLPADFAARAEHEEKDKGSSGRARIVADYIAGMTDRFATREFQRLV